MLTCRRVATRPDRLDSRVDARGRSRLTGWRARAGRVLRAVEAFVPTRRAAITLLVVAFGVYWLEALAWPLDRARDTWDYMSYYLQIWEGDPVFRALMVMRTPITPLTIGIPLHIGGPWLLEVVMGLLFAMSILAWSKVALCFGRFAALATAVVLLAYPPYGSLFHAAASDGVFAAAFALWALALVSVARDPATWKLAVLGAGVVGVFLTRPAGGVLIAFVLFPLVLAGSLGRRVVHTAAFAVVTAALLVGWMGYNAVRYDDFTLTRQRAAWVPFGGAYADREIRAENGPASRKLAQAVERHILTAPAYRRVGVDVETYFNSPSNYEFIHLLALSDRVWGWSSDYRTLEQAAGEAGAEDSGGLGLRGIGRRMRLMLDFRYSRDASRPRGPEPPPAPTFPSYGGRIPNPAALGPVPLLIPYGWIWCASPELRRCVLRDPADAISDPGKRSQYVSIARRLDEWDSALPTRAGRWWLAAQLNRYMWRMPPGWFWVVLGALALVIRRPAGSRIAAALMVSGLLVIFAHAFAGVVEAQYALPVYPAFIVAAIAGLTGPKPVRAARNAA